MEKENVLEIETQEVFNKVAIRIKHQNFGVLKRGEFYDEAIKVESFLVPEYVKDDNKLYIQGEEESKDSRIFLIDRECLKKVLEIVNKINEKYGIPKRWRADYNKMFYFIESYGEANCINDIRAESDTSKYKLGNYFKTKEEAQKIIDSKEWQEFWDKVRAGEIGGDE